MDWNRFAMEWAQSSLWACWLRSCFRRLEALLRVNSLQVFVDALLSFYGANELLGLFLFLFIEEAGVPLWFLPGDVLVMLAGSRPDRTPGSVAMLLIAATAGVSIGSSLLYAVVRRGGPMLLDRHGHFLHLVSRLRSPQSEASDVGE